MRAAIDGRGVYPRALPDSLPIWLAVGGTPASVGRAALGLPLAIAIIGGYPERFAQLTDFYREAGLKAGHAPEKLKVESTLTAILRKTLNKLATNSTVHTPMS